MEKLNREQRRQQRFGHHRAPTAPSGPGGWPESNPNPVFAEPAADAEATPAAAPEPPAKPPAKSAKAKSSKAPTAKATANRTAAAAD